jgi:hypothetical protein
MLNLEDGTIVLTTHGARSLPVWLGLGSSDARVLSITVTLERSRDPVVWRRLRVPADIRLDRFHQVLGAAIGWEDSHLHVFARGDDRYGHPDPDLEFNDNRGTTLGKLLVHAGDRLDYEYDFGDGWRHDIVLDSIDAGGHDPLSRCTEGAGRCPPEDVGGISGYQHLRRVIADPDHVEHAQLLQWLGLERANEAIAAVLRTRPA